MTNNSKSVSEIFDALMQRMKSPVGFETPTPEAVQDRAEDDYHGYTNLIEAEYNELWVAVTPKLVKAHRELIDDEVKSAESAAMREYWLARRQPKLVDGVPHLPLADTLEAFDYIWADKNNLLDAKIDDTHGELCSPQCNSFYDITTQLFEYVWNGLDADYIVKKLEESLYNPGNESNILTGRHSARQVAETILDLAHAHRAEIKGPNRQR